MGILSDVNLLLKGYQGQQAYGGTIFISALSNPNFFQKHNLVLPDAVPSSEHKLLPLTCLGKEDSHPAAAWRNFCCSGFGFDPKSEDYKAVRFLQNKELEFEDDQGIEFEDDRELAMDKYRVELYSVNSLMSLFFHLTLLDEEFSTFPMPLECKLWGDNGVRLLEFDRSLAFVTYPLQSNTEQPFDIWVWNGESWNKKFTTEPLRGVLRLLGFSKSGKHMFLEGSNYQLMLYNLETTELKDTGIRYDLRGTMPLIHYVESSAQLSGKSLAKKGKLHDPPDIENKEVKDINIA
ncbi:hypothetical protein PTKIN_Ptkin02bG0235300 [Pterospermum kingtungense]